jgi:hypothetical protein
VTGQDPAGRTIGLRRFVPPDRGGLRGSASAPLQGTEEESLRRHSRPPRRSRSLFSSLRGRSGATRSKVTGANPGAEQDLRGTASGGIDGITAQNPATNLHRRRRRCRAWACPRPRTMRPTDAWTVSRSSATPHLRAAVTKIKGVLVRMQPLRGRSLQHLHILRGVRRPAVLDLPRATPIRVHDLDQPPSSRSSPSRCTRPPRAKEPGLVHTTPTKTASQQQLSPEMAQVRSHLALTFVRSTNES